MNRIAKSLGRLRWSYGLFTLIVLLQVAVSAISIDVLSDVRAYVAGESLYSKGQKDALLHLHHYIQSRDEKDYQRFLAALDAPRGDRIAREALQLTERDEAAAQRGFLAGGNHPDDIDGMIRLFVWFHDIPFMADAISIWTEADGAVEELRALVEQARAHVFAGDIDADPVRALRTRVPVLNERLTNLESEFSGRLGQAARQTQRLLIRLNFAVAAALIVAGWRLSERPPARASSS